MSPSQALDEFNLSITYLEILVADISSLNSYLRQSIQEWTKYNLWKTAFKKFKGA